ncbi:hypothetical protein OV090_12645 [Nannocystis sp. RBIL2]|nr:hypothetical protein [Nannocystis sp. RBIL2]MCY1065621.1 hypothetical protein [Nannocystis sp. RBIL2]
MTDEEFVQRTQERLDHPRSEQRRLHEQSATTLRFDLQRGMLAGTRRR